MSSMTVSTVMGETCRTTRRLRDGGNLKNSQVGEEFYFWFIGVGTEARVPQSHVGLPQECCSIWFGLPLRLPQLCHIAADCRTDFAAEKRNIAAVDARLPLQRHKFAAASVNFAAANGILGLANWGTGKEFNICRTFNCHTLPLHIAATAAAPLQRQNLVALYLPKEATMDVDSFSWKKLKSDKSHKMAEIFKYMFERLRNGLRCHAGGTVGMLHSPSRVNGGRDGYLEHQFFVAWLCLPTSLEPSASPRARNLSLLANRNTLFVISSSKRTAAQLFVFVEIVKSLYGNVVRRNLEQGAPYTRSHPLSLVGC
ncbi:hypothetical protein C8R45DRAFT_924157 [Mycena sanguinolenta]|nr:hypothetical protein C8R45DRAFT_924157 [Mycena sanguinolenta]